MKRAILAAVVAAEAFALAGCGIETYLNLFPPTFTATMSDVNRFVELSNVPTDESDFLGYELYYKFYFYGQPGILTTSPTSLPVLKNNGFLRVCSPYGSIGSQAPPLIAVDAADKNSYVITRISFEDREIPASAEYGSGSSSASPYTLELRRSVEDAGEPKAFKRTAFVSTDADVASIWASVQSDLSERLHLVLYVLSCGTGAQYSTANYIGYMVYENVVP